MFAFNRRRNQGPCLFKNLNNSLVDYITSGKNWKYIFLKCDMYFYIPLSYFIPGEDVNCSSSVDMCTKFNAK